MKPILSVCLLLVFCLMSESSQSIAAAAEVIERGPIKAKSGLSIKVRAEGPATRQTDLQIACFFEYEPDDVMIGGTEFFDQKMKGAIKELRKTGVFEGHALETLLITPPKDTVPARKLLLIGLGDKKTFNAESMESVGKVAVREALKWDVREFSMSPNVTDAGVTTIPVGQFDKALVQGILAGFSAQSELARKGLVPASKLKEFTLEAGEKNIPAAEGAVKEAIKQVD